jgi:ABC-type multidrug transport system ATPase subunit
MNVAEVHKAWPNKAIEVREITKSFEGQEVLKAISFVVPKGEIFGIIGPDGAGKTTLFRILTTLLLADSGEAVVAGDDVVRDFKSIRSKVGYMPGRFSLYPDLSVEENLQVFASIFNTSLEENYDLIKDIYGQIEPFKKRRAGALSGGMKQKLALSCALIHKPEVLFLDEPTTGVDPVSRKEFWDMLYKLKNEGITILVSTPYMDEASRCDRIALIQDGSFLKIDSPEEIIEQYDKTLWAVRAKAMYPLLQDLRALDYVDTCYAFGDSHHITIKPRTLDDRVDDLTPETLKNDLREKGHEEIEIEVIRAGIEDCFMELAG